MDVKGQHQTGLLVGSNFFVQSLLLLLSVFLHDVKTCADKIGLYKLKSLSCFRVFVLGRRLNKGKDEEGPASSLSVGHSCERLGPGPLSRLRLC